MTQSRSGCLFEILETVVLTVLIFLGIQTFVAQPYKVQQSSMERTLLQDQYVLVDKLSPRWDQYGRGDIIVFDPPEAWSGGSDVPFIKRIIGVAGDTVELRDGLVLVNGIDIDEPYIYLDDGEPQLSLATPGGPSTWAIGEGQVFVMGDHRMASADSRNFGPIEVGNIIGRAWLRYFPFDSITLIDQPTYAELAPGAP